MCLLGRAKHPHVQVAGSLIIVTIVSKRGTGRTRRDTGPHKASSTSTHTSHDLSSDDGDEVKENRPRNEGGGRLAGALTGAAAASDSH